MFYCYTHARPDGRVFYVGKGCGGRAHYFHGRSEYHARILKKYGAKNIIVEMFPCASEAAALQREIEMIAEYRAAGVELCNRTDGGEGCSGMVHSQHTIEKLRDGWTPEKREALGRAKRGVGRSEETKRLIAERTKLAMTAERIERRRVSMAKGDSPERRKRMSDAQKKSMTDERRALLSEKTKAYFTPEKRVEVSAARKQAMTPEVKAKLREKALIREAAKREARQDCFIRR